MFENSFFDLRTWWPPIVAALGGVAIGILVRQTILRWLEKLAAKSAFKYDDVLVDAMRNPIVIWCALLGIRLAVRLMSLAPEAEQTISSIILVSGILSVTWAIARFAGGAIRAGAKAGHLPAVSLFAAIARLFIMALGALMILQLLGIPILSIVTAFGIGGLAIGLALQDTLANFFAGLRIIAARKIRPGDLIKLETGQEGFVEDINWGLTTLREGAGNLVIVPNAKLGSAIVVNYALPSAPQNVTVDLGVSYNADLDRVEKIVLDVALQTQHEVKEAVATFVPAFRYKEFGEYAVKFFVVLQAQSHQDRWAVVSGFVKRLHQRFKAEGLSIPLPHRVVVTKTESVTPASPASP
jgi:small-conductance mechanosensitive channel